MPDTPPPGRLAGTGAQAGPLCFRGLNQNAVNHTCAPAGTVPGNVTSSVVRPVFPWNVHAVRSSGGVAPTKLNTLAPVTPAGRPRWVGVSAFISRTLAVRPVTDSTATIGAD